MAFSEEGVSGNRLWYFFRGKGVLCEGDRIIIFPIEAFGECCIS